MAKVKNKEIDEMLMAAIYAELDNGMLEQIDELEEIGMSLMSPDDHKPIRKKISKLRDDIIKTGTK